MLASVLNPYLGKNRRTFPSILPHMTREFSNEPAVEAILRPRLPLVSQNLETVNPLVPDSLQVPAQVPVQDRVSEIQCPRTESLTSQSLTMEIGYVEYVE